MATTPNSKDVFFFMFLLRVSPLWVQALIVAILVAIFTGLTIAIGNLVEWFYNLPFGFLNFLNPH